MPETKKKSSNVNTTSAKPSDDTFEDILEYAEDEDIIPVKPRKKKSSSGSSKKKGTKKKQNDRHLLFSEKKFARRRSMFDILTGKGATRVEPKFLGIKRPLWRLICLGLILMLVGYVVISNGNLSVINEQVTVVGLSEDLENYRILVLSDLNAKRFGDDQSSLIREVNSLSYDMILCVGDMVGESGDSAPFFEFLEGIKYPSRVYFICGDADPGPFVDESREIQGTLQQLVLEDWILGAIDRGAHYIDRPTAITVGSSRIWLTPSNFMNLEAVSYRNDWKEQTESEENGVVSGLSSDYATLPFTSYRYQIAMDFYSAIDNMSNEDLIIAMSHCVPNDDAIIKSSSHSSSDGKYMTAPDLIVAGHYCGGVWHIPIIEKTLYVPNDMLPRNGWFPADEDVHGLSQIGETQVYITGGLSTTSAIKIMPFRFVNDPEMSILTLTAKLPDNILEIK